MFRTMLVLMVFTAAAYGQEVLLIDGEKVIEATGTIQILPLSNTLALSSDFEINDPSEYVSTVIVSSSEYEALKIKSASQEIEIKEKDKQINQLTQQINGAAGELKRLTYLLQDKETELANLYQLLKQFSEEIDKSKTAEDKEKFLQSSQQTIFNVLFNNTRKGISK